jgi:hypothetical protein
MLGEQEKDKLTKADDTMKFLAKLPLKILIIFTGLVLFLLFVIVLGNEAMRLLNYYLRSR